MIKRSLEIKLSNNNNTSSIISDLTSTSRWRDSSDISSIQEKKKQLKAIQKGSNRSTKNII